MILLPFDTETTGIPDWKTPSDDPGQPHIVQLGAILYNEETGDIASSLDIIVRPDGWVIPDECINVHGITNERAMDEGVSEQEALEAFMAMYDQCDLRLAHNTTFDNRIIRIALKRYQPDRVSDEEWKDRQRYYCTLMNAKRDMGGNRGHTLGECLLHYCGRQHEDAHSALPDAQACLDIYLAQQSGRA